MTEEWNGRRVRALMTALGLTATELGAALGVSAQAVANWLGDQNRISKPVRKVLERMERKAAKGGEVC